MSSNDPIPGDTHDPVLERSIHIGNAFSTVLYGINLFMYGQSVYFLVHSKRSEFRQRLFYVLYGGAMVVLITVALAANEYLEQMMYIEHRDHSGGPLGYYTDNISAWYNTFGSAADITVNLLGDALLVYRCYIIWGSNLWIAAVPALMLVGSTVFAVMTVVASALPDANFFTGPSKGFGVPWIALTVSLNILVTVMICAKLLIVRYRVRSIMSREMSDMYTGLVAILVESAAPFAILGIAFLVTFAKELDVAIVFAFIWGTLCAVSPQLIIFRVSMGRAWTGSTMTQLTTSNGLETQFGKSQERPINLDSFGQSRGESETMNNNSETALDKSATSRSLIQVA